MSSKIKLPPFRRAAHASAPLNERFLSPTSIELPRLRGGCSGSFRAGEFEVDCARIKSAEEYFCPGGGGFFAGEFVDSRGCRLGREKPGFAHRTRRDPRDIRDARAPRAASPTVSGCRMEITWLLTLTLCTLAHGELRQSVSATKMPWPEELYLEQSFDNNEPVESGNWPVDDDDYDNSGSGSGHFESEIQMVTYNPAHMNPDIKPTGGTPRSVTVGVEPTTRKKIGKKPFRTEATVDTPVKEEPKVIDDFVIEKPTINTDDNDVSAEKHSESLFQRTEVLAAVIAGGVIGFLFAIFLILLLVYRMRKKDEGSYDLGERKPSTAAYQKAPTKEFYA
ncbi:syndecan-2 [Chiloscyllium plagiosum]|uniref:syndecan-2 n=1 Tax=Chiloscyllium plagiosum TaxID=36176 RepID=UPI001CB8149C|nr:syndecan-2 [Chiloscyllium plagiosum]